MKHNVGDLVARRDIDTGEIKLGFISRSLAPTRTRGYYVYFFEWNNEVWYSEEYVDAFKQVLENWKTNDQ
jgi:hypothetical protein